MKPARLPKVSEKYFQNCRSLPRASLIIPGKIWWYTLQTLYMNCDLRLFEIYWLGVSASNRCEGVWPLTFTWKVILYLRSASSLLSGIKFSSFYWLGIRGYRFGIGIILSRNFSMLPKMPEVFQLYNHDSKKSDIFNVKSERYLPTETILRSAYECLFEKYSLLMTFTVHVINTDIVDYSWFLVEYNSRYKQ